MHLVNQIEDRG